MDLRSLISLSATQKAAKGACPDRNAADRRQKPANETAVKKPAASQQKLA
jgi:hypothetical protein